MKIAILGYGVVGSGAYEILTASGYQVSKILDIRQHEELGDIVTSNYEDILSDSDIGVVVEAIGGLEPAHTFVVQAIKAGKSVVSSNKYLICTYYDELNRLATEHGVSLRFTASAGGGIPWLHNLSRATRCDSVKKIFGIMNGTTNFILDGMISDSKEFDDALYTAQKLGYAEANPSADIDGLDTARKTAISASIAFGAQIPESQVAVLSLRNIKKADIEYIKCKMDMNIRYVGSAENKNNRISAFVQPMIIASDSLLSGVHGCNNMISLVADNVGQLSFFGQGAGKYPTGVSVAQDVIDIMEGKEVLSNPTCMTYTDNSMAEFSYYIRTEADVPCDMVKSCEKIGKDNFIITNKISVSQISVIADEILKKDGESFLAGIER